MLYSRGFDVLVQVHKHGSVSKAATALGISAPAVSAQIKSMEEQFGIVFFHRTTRSVTATNAMEKLAITLQNGEAEFTDLLNSLSGEKERPYGKLRLNAPMAFGEKFLVSPIAEFARLYPEVTIDAEFNDNRVHLIEEGYDLIIRIGKLEDSGLIAKRLSGFNSILCASPEFLKRYQKPENPSDLSHLPAVIYSNASAQLSYRNPAGKAGHVALQPAIYANAIGMLLEATMKGIGIARLPAFACKDYIDSGALVSLLPDYTLIPEMDIYAIYPDRRYLPLKVRKFIDLLGEKLGELDKQDRL